MLLLCTVAHFNISIRSRFDPPATNSVARREITSQPAFAMSEDASLYEVIFKSLMQLESLLRCVNGKYYTPRNGHTTFEQF